MKRTLLVAGALLGAGILTSCSLLPKEEEFQEAPIVKEYEGVSYGKTSVIKGDLTQSESLSGTYKGTTKFELQSPGEQKVKKVFVKVGSKVFAGDVLIRYYIDSYEKKVNDTEFNMKKMRLQIKQQQELKNLEVEKQKRLGSSKSVIQSVREQYDATISSFQTDLKIMQLELDDAKAGIEESDGTSDIDGTVTKIEKGLEGSTPDADLALITVEGKKKNRFEIKSKYATRYKAGDTVTVDVKGQEYEMRVAKPLDRKNVLYLYPTASSIKFESGDNCKLECILKQKKGVLYLPSSTIFEMGNQKVVYVENEEGLKTMKEVQVGETINHLTEIVSGLNEGDQVITN